ncbi:hypothetical protein N9N27_04515 [Planktomarina sp.]|nr:hypothetical protein [Planktomarina sp.]
MYYTLAQVSRTHSTSNMVHNTKGKRAGNGPNERMAKAFMDWTKYSKILPHWEFRGHAEVSSEKNMAT